MLNNVKDAVPGKYKRFILNRVGRITSMGRTKVFGIGLNKTGTTSLKAAMVELGYSTGHQRTAELLMKDWAKRDFRRIISYCKSARFFQDQPFSRPYTYVVLDHEFPNSKFILTVRDSAEHWYESLIKFHAKKWGKDERVPTKEDLQRASYIQKGWAWQVNRMNYDTPEGDPYKKDILLGHYNAHNNSVREYFRHRREDLLILNVSENGAYEKLCRFLGVQSDRKEFPWKNKTEEVE